MMFKRVLLLAVLVAVLVVPGAAEIVIYDETFTWTGGDFFYSFISASGTGYSYPQSQIYITPLLSSLEPIQIMSQAPASYLSVSGSNPTGSWPVTFTSGGVVIGSGEFYYFQYWVGDTLYTQSVVDFLDMDWGGVVSGKIVMSAAPEGYAYPYYKNSGYGVSSTPKKLKSDPATPGYASCFWDGAHGYIDRNIKYYTTVSYDWANRVRITDTARSVNNITRFELIRNAIPGYKNYSSLYITDAHNFNYTSLDSNNDVMFTFLPDRYPLEMRLKTPMNHWFNTTIIFGETPTEEPTGLRTGSVTMTDHNGTTITGFEVTAVNRSEERRVGKV